MDLSKWQEEIGLWQIETFGAGGAERCRGIFNHLREEVDEELLHEVYANKAQGEGFGEELADVLILTLAMASRAGVDAEAALKAKMDKNKTRKWKVADENGIIRHVEE